MTDGSSLHESACHMCQYFAKEFPHIPPRVMAGVRRVRGRWCRARNESAAGLSGNGCRQLVTSTAGAPLQRSGRKSVQKKAEVSEVKREYCRSRSEGSLPNLGASAPASENTAGGRSHGRYKRLGF